jgi:hypothetical protein
MGKTKKSAFQKYLTFELPADSPDRWVGGQLLLGLWIASVSRYVYQLPGPSAAFARAKQPYLLRDLWSQTDASAALSSPEVTSWRGDGEEGGS